METLADASNQKALPFHEPTIITILVQTSFLLLLNIVNWALDAAIYCGLIGQVFLGIFWGTPLGDWLERAAETTVVNLGYLGLILLVYEGGLNTSMGPLVANLPLSIAVALTGIFIPIALSFLLAPITGASSLQCFAAGAALSATSLGTTFTILASAGFVNTRLGTVLTSAAMMDDVIGLVMIQVVGSLGRNEGNITGEAIGRPIGASVGLLVFVVAATWALGKLLLRRNYGKIISGRSGKFTMQTGVLIALVVVASYAGASVLFAAFLAGIAIGWWDEARSRRLNPASEDRETPAPARVSGAEVYEHYYQTPVSRIFAPFFFASIGFSIPIADMFRGETVWKGIVYSLLMFVGKFVTAVWLLPISVPAFGRKSRQQTSQSKAQASTDNAISPENHVSEDRDTVAASAEGSKEREETPQKPGPNEAKTRRPRTKTTGPAKKPRSLYPAAILGLAMVSRGEVAFLIASVAEAEGIFDAGSGGAGKDIYLIVMWAAMLCTIAGPLVVGILVKRVKKLEKQRLERGGSGDSVLGSWGVGG